MTEESGWRPIVAYALYYAGDAVSRLMRVGAPFGHLYPVYSRLMSWSSAVQGPV